MRLLEEFVKERTLLESVIAERLGRQPQDVFCVMTARLAAAMLEYLAELTWTCILRTRWLATGKSRRFSSG